MSKLKAILNNIIIEPFSEEEKNIAGIYIPQKEVYKNRGTVISVGEDCKSGIKEGDKILIKKFVAQEIKWEGKDLLIVKEEDCLGFLE